MKSPHDALREAVRQAVADFDDLADLARNRVDDGDDMGSRIWRVALTDIAQEARDNAERARDALALIHQPEGEDLPYQSDDWKLRGYPSAAAEIEDMANVGRALIEAVEDLTKPGAQFAGWHPADCPTEIIYDLANQLLEAPTSPHIGDEGLREALEIYRLTLKILADQPDDTPLRECKPMIAQALAKHSPNPATPLVGEGK